MGISWYTVTVKNKPYPTAFAILTWYLIGYRIARHKGTARRQSLGHGMRTIKRGFRLQRIERGEADL